MKYCGKTMEMKGWRGRSGKPYAQSGRCHALYSWLFAPGALPLYS